MLKAFRLNKHQFQLNGQKTISIVSRPACKHIVHKFTLTPYLTLQLLILPMHKAKRGRIKKYLVLPVFVFGKYKWPFRCFKDFIENRRRFDQIFGPYQHTRTFHIFLI